MKSVLGRGCCLLLTGLVLLCAERCAFSALPVQAGDDERVAQGYARLLELKPDLAIRSLSAPYIEALGDGDLNRAARYLLLIGYGFRIDDNDDACAQCCLLATRLDSENVLAKVMAGEYLFRAGRVGEAEKVWRQLDSLPQNDALVLRARAHEHASRNESAKAEACLRKIIEINSEDLPAHHQLASLHHWRRELKQAAVLFEKCGKITTSPYQRELYAGVVAECNEDWVAAERHYRQAGAIEPRDSAWHDCLGMLFIGLHRPKDAGEQLALAVNCPRLSMQIAVHYAAFLTFTGQPIKSTQVLRRLVALKPNSAAAHHSLGSNYSTTGRLNEAEIELRRSIDLNPRKNQTYSSLLALEQVKNDEKKVSQIIEQWKLNSPEYWECLAFDANLSLKHGRYKEARQSFLKAELAKPAKKKLDPNFHLKLCRIYCGLTTCFYKENDMTQALVYAKLFNETKPSPEERAGVPVRPPRLDFAGLAPGSKELKAAEHGLLADALFETHNLDDAASQYNEAINYEPTNINWHAALLKVYIDKRDIPGAAREDAVVSQHMLNKLGEALNFGNKKAPPKQ